jgi:hypothetical protein
MLFVLSECAFLCCKIQARNNCKRIWRRIWGVCEAHRKILAFRTALEVDAASATDGTDGNDSASSQATPSLCNGDSALRMEELTHSMERIVNEFRLAAVRRMPYSAAILLLCFLIP